MKLFPFKDETFSIASLLFFRVGSCLRNVQSDAKNEAREFTMQWQIKYSSFQESISFYCKRIHEHWTEWIETPTESVEPDHNTLVCTEAKEKNFL